MNEFEIIKRYFTQQRIHRRDVVLGIGDDGAITKYSKQSELILTTDTLVSGIHFPKHTSPEDLGYKALVVNLSDLAAMGATPAWFMLSLTMSRNTTSTWLQSFAKGLFQIAKSYEVQLIGGNLSRGPLSITVQALGFVPKGQALLRSYASHGDRIYVTGTLGDAALGLRYLMKKIKLKKNTRAYALSRFNRPQPKIEIGLLLRRYAHAVIDISDGLLADLGHLLKQSRVGAQIDIDRIPLSRFLKRALPASEAFMLALTGGEDYELCFTVPEKHCRSLEKIMKKHKYRITPIGIITKTQHLHITDSSGNKYHVGKLGYQHFA